MIAYGHGATTETLRPLGGAAAPTAVFHDAQTAASLGAAIERFEAEGDAISPAACRANAERFSQARFDAELRAFLASRGVAVG